MAVWVVALVVVGPSTVHAGSADDGPHVEDGEDDVQVTWDPVFVHVAVPEIDIVWASVLIGDHVYEFHLVVQDLSARTVQDDASLLYTFAFEAPGFPRVFVDARLSQDTWRFHLARFPSDGEQISTTLTGTIDEELNRITVFVPRDLVDLPFTKTGAGSILLVRHPNGATGGGIVWFRDRAPDTGFGRDVT